MIECWTWLGVLLFLQEIRQAAEFMELPELLVYVSNIQAREEFLNPELKQLYRQVRVLGQLLYFVFKSEVNHYKQSKMWTNVYIGNKTRLCF